MRSTLGSGFLLGLVLFVSASRAASFQFIDLSEVYDMTPDGSVIVGSNQATGTNGIWSNGVYQPATLPPLYPFGGTAAVAADGATMYGRAVQFFPGGSNAYAVRWNGLANPTLLPELAGGQNQAGVNACSANGAIAVGHSFDAVGMQPVRWTPTGIEKLSGGASYFGGVAMDITADGSTIVGYLWETNHGQSKPFRWTAASGVQLLPDAELTGIARAITPDGSTTVGRSGALATRWTQAQVQTLGTLDPLFREDSIAMASSDDASVIGGQSWYQGEYLGFLWDEANGMRNLTTYIPSLGFNLQGQYIEQVNAISADGSMIVGRSFGPMGGKAFVLSVPEPSGLAMVTVAIVAAAARRRGRNRTAPRRDRRRRRCIRFNGGR